MDSKEIEVKGYKLLVSRDGTVHQPTKQTTYSYVRFGKTVTRTAVFKARLLRPSMTHMGYLEVCFVHKRKKFRFLVHRLVGMAFVDGYAEGLVINHKDANKLNNAPGNLEWVTKSRNSEHAWENGLIPLIGEDHAGAKLTAKQVSHIRKLLAAGISASTIAAVANVSSSLIYRISQGNRWAHVEAAA